MQDVAAALSELARATARIRAGDGPVDAVIEGALAEGALANLSPEAAAAARACLDDVVALRGRATRATQLRETLLASLAHDLRNPLNTFAMSTGLLKDDLERDDVDVTRDLGLLQRMERGIDRMRRMIEDLLDASRIEARRIELVRRPEAALSLVRDAVAAALPLAEERGAHVAEGEVDPALRVTVDRARAVQMLGKCLAFAARTCGEDGRVLLSAARDGDLAVFSVTATVPASAGPPGDARGGLALEIARGLVELHGGTFELALGDPTTMTIRLPAAP
jgi:signal transduction histidine kinase